MNTSSLTDGLFSSDGMRHIFSDRNTIQRMLDVEAALARALAAEDLIPNTAVASIVNACRAELIDADVLASSVSSAGNLAIPLVKQLTAVVASKDADAARYVHWGATSQDVIDTGRVLQLREAIDLITVDLSELADILASLAHQHAATLVMGRTWMQHAQPTTLGLKIAGWLDAIMRHQDRLHAVRARVCVLQCHRHVGQPWRQGIERSNCAREGLVTGASGSALAYTPRSHGRACDDMGSAYGYPR